MIRACLFGTFNATHPANRLLADALRAAPCEVTLCHEPLWEQTRDKMAEFFGARSLARLGVAYMRVAARLAARWRRLPPPDVVVAGFNGQLDVFLARLIARRRTRLLFAPLMTVTETLVDDRRVYQPRSLAARLAAALDRRTLALSDLVLLDSNAHRAYVAGRLGSRARTATFYLGADPTFTPTPARRRARTDPLRVLFYGQYVPLHGAQVIVEAAALVGAEGGIELTMIGTGPERAAAERRARGFSHVRFVDWVEYDALPARLAACDVTLGSFGATAKARIVIPTKVYQAAASGRAIVTGDNPAVRELFTPGEHLLAVPAGDAEALAAALRMLRDSPEFTERLGTAAARLVNARLDRAAQGASLRAVLSAAFPELAARFDAPAATASARDSGAARPSAEPAPPAVLEP